MWEKGVPGPAGRGVSNLTSQCDPAPRDLIWQVAQEQGGLFAVHGILEERAVKGAMKSPWTGGDAGDSIVTIAMGQNRRWPDRAPWLADGRIQKEPGFINEDAVGQTVRFH